MYKNGDYPVSDLDRYINKRKKQDPEFAKEFEIGYESFKISVILENVQAEKDFQSK